MNIPDSNRRHDPPPAATVLMSSCGAWMVTPAVVVSKTCSRCPSNLDTSVEVPPMSNPITGLFPHACNLRLNPPALPFPSLSPRSLTLAVSCYLDPSWSTCCLFHFYLLPSIPPHCNRPSHPTLVLVTQPSLYLILLLYPRPHQQPSDHLYVLFLSFSSSFSPFSLFPFSFSSIPAFPLLSPSFLSSFPPSHPPRYLIAGLGIPHHSSSWSRQDRAEPVELLYGRQSSIGLQEQAHASTPVRRHELVKQKRKR